VEKFNMRNPNSEMVSMVSGGDSSGAALSTLVGAGAGVEVVETCAAAGAAVGGPVGLAAGAVVGAIAGYLLYKM
jgi:hypothetical protein